MINFRFIQINLVGAKILLVIIYIIVFHNVTAATFSMNEGYTAAYMEILRLRFTSAETLIRSERLKDPSNLAYVYLDSYTGFLKSVISEEDIEYTNFITKKSNRANSFESIKSDSPWRLYSLGQLHLQSSIAEVKAGDYVKAAIDIRKAYNYFVENESKFPSFRPNRAGLGLMHLLIGSVPDSYTWIPGIMGMEGDVNKGSRALKDVLLASKQDKDFPYLFHECFFLNAFITYNLAGFESGSADLYELINSESLMQEAKKSPVLIYAISSIYSHQGKNDLALSLLLERPQDKSYYEFNYLDYLTGIAYLNKLDNRARVYLLKYVTHFKGKNYLKAAYQRIAWSYLSDGDTSGYRKYISRVGIFGNAFLENDKEASKEYNRNKTPNVKLLRARLLFDGGYYNKAEGELSALFQETLTTDERIELLYRTARINHKEGKIQKAKLLYLETYNKGKTLTLYYAANSLLLVGILNEKEHLYNEAYWCYKECLKLRFDEYQSSIHQKAKAGLNRLRSIKKAAL